MNIAIEGSNNTTLKDKPPLKQQIQKPTLSCDNLKNYSDLERGPNLAISEHKKTVVLKK